MVLLHSALIVCARFAKNNTPDPRDTLANMFINFLSIWITPLVKLDSCVQRIKM